jgi:hypothetical protein
MLSNFSNLDLSLRATDAYGGQKKFWLATIARCRAGFHQMLGRRQLFGIVMDPIVITFITACTAFVSAIVGPFITFRIGKAQISASVLSANR